MNFKEQGDYKIQEVEKIVFSYLPEVSGPQAKVIDAMHYSVTGGGKRIRPLFMREAFHLFGGSDEEKVAPFMAALEFIHNYSLIHDDLPAMDNDEFRRGRRTTHVVYGEDLAILAGDALLNYAYEVAIRTLANYPRDFGVMRALNILADKAGIFGMVGGQCVDVMKENEHRPMNMEELLFIHENKTAALIECALMCGAALAGAEEENILKMEKAGSAIGLAFQIQDDILDITSTTEELGKPVGSDAKNHKTTYPALRGMESSKKEVKHLSESAITMIQSVNGDSEFLVQLVDSLINRRS